MDLTIDDIYDSAMSIGSLHPRQLAEYLLDNSPKILDMIRCKLMAADANISRLIYIHSLLVKIGEPPMCIPILWHQAFTNLVNVMKCIPEDDLTYSVVYEYISYHSYLFQGPDILETLRNALTMISANPMASPLWCMITQAIMECAPQDKKRDLCIESLDESCSKIEFIHHVLLNASP